MSCEKQPARHKHQPTKRAPNEPARPMCPRKHILGQIWPFWGQKSLFLQEKTKVFVPMKRKNQLSTLFALFLVSHGTKWAENANICLKITKNAYFGPNMAVIGPKIQSFMRGSKSFDTHIMEKQPRHLICIVFWSATGSNGPKMPIFGEKSQFWAKFGRLWVKNPNFYGSK